MVRLNNGNLTHIFPSLTLTSKAGQPLISCSLIIFRDWGEMELIYWATLTNSVFTHESHVSACESGTTESTARTRFLNSQPHMDHLSASHSALSLHDYIKTRVSNRIAMILAARMQRFHDAKSVSIFPILLGWRQRFFRCSPGQMRRVLYRPWVFF